MTSHSSPPKDASCMGTFEDLDDTNYVEYFTEPSKTWHPSMYSQEIIESLLDSQFESYMNRVQQTDCEVEMKRLITAGPPIYIKDVHALPLPENDSHISKLWFCSTNAEISAKLKGAKDGQEHAELWAHISSFLAIKDKGLKKDENKE